MTLTPLRACIYAYSTSIHGWGIEGQLTELRAEALGWSGLVWVRERGWSLRGGSFYESSGLRHGARIRGDDAGTLQVLELCAPERRWEAVAQAVADLDALDRPVRPNRQFTEAWARWQLSRQRPFPLHQKLAWMASQNRRAA